MGKLYWKPGNMLYPLPAVMVSVRDKDINNIITSAMIFVLAFMALCLLSKDLFFL